jgi:hypothetical protein
MEVMGVARDVMGDPTSWLLYFMENPNNQWMRTGGIPSLGNIHIPSYPHSFLKKYHDFFHKTSET